MAVLSLSEDIKLVHRPRRQSSGLRDDLEKGRGPDQFVLARLADGAENRHLLIFLDENGDVGGLRVFLIQDRRQFLLQFLGGQARDIDLADQDRLTDPSSETRTVWLSSGNSNTLISSRSFGSDLVIIDGKILSLAGQG